MRPLTIILSWFIATSAMAGWREDVAPGSLIGEGKLCIWGFCLYDAQLWGAHNPLQYDAPFALVLTYRRHITRERFVDTGMDEIKRQADRPVARETLQRWREYMLRALVDVGPGDVLCGVFLPGVGARFYANGRLTAQINDPQFAHAFFDIWLNADTRATSLRHRLLGAYDRP